ncbi:hypothetical protein ABIE78_000757 [Sinorhizobium fredii]|uniref:TnsA endonuclease N-terminal domain-containing protein n=1 Tax=Sinorhizobium fredii (strain USDA 257) TaxID=1185652 RepID=I3XBU4_SINF2|nr:hypothetical protein [Sinorhizobium fredii]AFL53350.1 hypothetical protein USDA257_c48150 [Sinorhizobium fredii USDA 257]
MGIAKRAASLRAVRHSASIRIHPPAGTVKCEGPRLYRSQVSRDVACLLDVNPSVAVWRCMPTALDLESPSHVPDFLVFDTDGGQMFVDAPDRSVDVAVVEAAARHRGARYWLIPREEVYSGPRLANARDLLRYADHDTPLGDRLRLLAALDEHGSMPVAECLKAFQETRPVPGIASLILRGFIEVDLDEGLLGPETTVRRISR